MSPKPPNEATQHLSRNRALILGRALLAGAAGLVPVPYLDDLLAGGVRSQLVRRLAEVNHVDVDANAVAALATPNPSRILGAAGLGAAALGGAKRIWRKVAASIVVVRRADEVIQTFQLGTLFDHYCTRHHVGLGIDGAKAERLRMAMDQAIRHARGRAVEDNFRRAVGKARAVAGRLRRRNEAEQVEAELAGPASAYVAALVGAFDVAWAPHKQPQLEGGYVKQRADLRGAERVVIKIGSRLLAEDTDGRVATLAAEAQALRARGVEVVIVTSGAIALGWRRLGYPEKPRTIPALQASAAVGQGHLIHAWQRALAAHDLAAGQVLLTHDDVRNRRRYLNARLAFAELLRAGAVPVVNENDTVSVDEIKFGDNDRLAALCTSLVEADALVILTDVDGLYDGDPASGARLIPEVRDIDNEAVAVAGGSSGGFGTGGMASKVQAAKIAGRFGVVTIVASGRRERPVTSVLDGADNGTVFWPSVSRLQSRKHWIAYALKPAGTLTVDAGARRALVDGKKSLLPSGVRGVDGSFGAGDPVRVVDESGAEFARGLCAFDAGEVERIAGKKSTDLASILGYASVEEVIHRDDLVLL